jgi:phosphoribosyl 1,2-cyclic phosphate phosphodiesterase
VTDCEGNNILVDIGPDFRAQMLTHDVRHLEAILITHAHRDHVGGIDDIRPLNWVQKCNMEVYANKQAIDTLQHDYHYIFEPHQFPGLPEANLHEVDAPFSIPGTQLEIVPIKALHKDLPILGFRVGEMAYITDANHIAPEEMEKLQGVQLLVINALRKTQHFSHYSLPEALEVIEKVAPRQAYLTHISHEMGLHADVERELPEGVHLAYDNLQVTL